MGVLDIPDEVESIGESAFSNCKMLEGIIFPESMETIRQGAFNDCIYNHRTTKTNQKYPSVNL